MEEDGTATAAVQAKERGGIASRVASSSSIACGGPLEQVGRCIVFLALCFVLFIMGLLKGLRFIFPTFILSSSSWQLPTIPPFFAFFFCWTFFFFFFFFFFISVWVWFVSCFLLPAAKNCRTTELICCCCCCCSSLSLSLRVLF